VLGHYGRDLGLLGLEEAVPRMTQLPARFFGLRDRGEIRPGAYADMVVFDAQSVADRATFDMPKLPSAGIDLVLVNGQPVWQQGATTPARPGKLLRRADAGVP
jgi:N-acyl-D-amino-acid deacylase